MNIFHICKSKEEARTRNRHGFFPEIAVVGRSNAGTSAIADAGFRSCDNFMASNLANIDRVLGKPGGSIPEIRSAGVFSAQGIAIINSMQIRRYSNPI